MRECASPDQGVGTVIRFVVAVPERKEKEIPDRHVELHRTMNL